MEMINEKNEISQKQNITYNKLIKNIIKQNTT